MVTARVHHFEAVKDFENEKAFWNDTYMNNYEESHILIPIIFDCIIAHILSSLIICNFVFIVFLNIVIVRHVDVTVQIDDVDDHLSRIKINPDTVGHYYCSFNVNNSFLG